MSERSLASLPLFLRRRSSDLTCMVLRAALLLCFLALSIAFFAIGAPRYGVRALLYLLIVPAFFAVEFFLRIRIPPLLTLLLGGLALGSLAGSGFDFYVTIPFLDLILHAMSGVIFAAVGYGIMARILGNDRGRARFFACLFFAVAFSLAIATLWELFEYSVSAIFGADMQEDTLVEGFRSYYLAGTHAYALPIEGITRTVIEYGDGQTLILNGYLDLGLLDTMGDMAICTAGALLCALYAIFCRLIGKRDRLLLAYPASEEDDASDRTGESA